MTGTEPPLAHIGEVVERTGLSHRTIRYYEEMELIRPVARTEGGFRLYDEAGIARLLLIKPMKPLGFSIEQTRDLLRALDALEDTGCAEEDRAAAQTLVDRMHASARQRVAELKETTVRAEAFTRRLGRLRRGPTTHPEPT